MLTGKIEEIIILPLSVGEYEENWKIAQDICVELSKHENEDVRANCAMGLAYIARTKGKLEKHIVKPIILKLLRECTGFNKYKVIDAISDLEIYMKCKIGKKLLNKIRLEERNSKNITSAVSSIACYNC